MIISGVQIAPYWIHTPPSAVSLTLGQTLRLRAQALGTPKPSFHWYRGSQELFVNERIAIEGDRGDDSLVSSRDSSAQMLGLSPSLSQGSNKFELKLAYD